MPSRSQEKLLRSLQGRKGREEHGLFLVEGPRLLPELLASGLEVTHLFYTAGALTGSVADEKLAELRAGGTHCERVPAGVIEEFADTVTPQGVLAVARVPPAGFRALPATRLLILDAVQDPGNVGTLLRTAEAMGMAGAVALSGTVDPWNPKVVRAAAGSSFRLPVVRAGREEALAELGRRGIRLWAADVEGEPLRRGDPRPGRLALVLGNEGRGVSEAVLAVAERRVRVEIAEDVESLNVAVAGALLIDRLFHETASPAPPPGDEDARGAGAPDDPGPEARGATGSTAGREA